MKPRPTTEQFMPAPDFSDSARPRRLRVALWALLVLLLLAAQTLLVALAFQYRSGRTQAAVEASAAAASIEITELLAHDLLALIGLPGRAAASDVWQARAEALLVDRPELVRIERRDPALKITDAADSRIRATLFGRVDRTDSRIDTELACAAARGRGGPTYSNSFFVLQADGTGSEVMDLCIAERVQDQVVGYVVASYSLAALLNQLSAQTATAGNDLSLIGGDGSRLAHGRLRVGAGVYRASRLINLPGIAMQIDLDSAATRPSLVPDLVSALVIGLSLALFGVVVLLARDVRRRSLAEAALADALSFRKAMEDSVVTGLRARDLDGRITYVNPAFCRMVGFGAEELVGTQPPPYWPPEHVEGYRRRQASRLAGAGEAHSREAFETTFMRKNGERFPVMIFEAPLLGSAGRHNGWMSAVLDLSSQRRVEEISRQQQERLQATARLATAGEMASLLSHELNQPLSAIAAYAAGSLNLLADQARGESPQADLWPLMNQALQRIAEQAERAGRVIKSVHDFVRRRESARESVSIDALIEAIQPLVSLQARKSGTKIEVDMCEPVPRAICDRAMVEQVLLNLTRNGIQAMQGAEAQRRRVLTIRVRRKHLQWVHISVHDRGPGIGPDVERQLFTPFFTTRTEGMGLGLSVCRTIVEQHGGAFEFCNLRDAAGSVCGAEFGFTLPAAAARADLPGRPGAPAGIDTLAGEIA